ncbi:hypothetical protein, partial [Methanobrevibacter sp.]|uniref:hypothetical protein n=1 Tax=Methanobrevibacter sp. TaxID=66852 RepID=UPI00388D51C2
MKLKEHTLIILSLFLMLFVCIGSVSALESQTDNIRENNEISISESPEILTASASDDAIGISSDENIISSNNRDWYVNASAADGGDGSNISPYNNFKSVLDNTNLQDGDNVYFAGKENYKGNGINVNLDINKQLNLLKYGSGEAVFDAEHNSRIFTVYASCINITGLTFINGNADNGGALYFSNAISNSNINATYTNNTAEDSGGANYFYWSVSNSNITGTYSHNTANNGNGGANNFNRDVSDSNINGTYINNTANNGKGGANFYWSVLNSNITGTYTNNTANNGNGGANCFWESVSDSNINGTYSHNTGEDFGGANNFNRDVSDSNINGTYINNTANNGNGGANCFWESVSDSNINGTYINNTASNAIIYFQYDEGLDAEITNAIFLNNKCEYEIYACSSGVVVKDSWFGNNASNYMNKPN